MIRFAASRLAFPLALLGVALAATILSGCESPDPEGVLDQFRDRVRSDAEGDVSADATDTDPTDTVATDTDPTDANGDTGCEPAPIEPNGIFLCALSATLNPVAPLYMAFDISLGDGELTIAAQPLIRDVNEDGSPMDGARTNAGDPLPPQVVPWAGDGAFGVTFSDVTVIGEANPVTFRDIAGTFELTGEFVNNDVAFGAMAGEVTSPTVVPLNGSTFACVRADDFASIDPVYYNDEIPYEERECIPVGADAGTGGDAAGGDDAGASGDAAGGDDADTSGDAAGGDA